MQFNQCSLNKSNITVDKMRDCIINTGCPLGSGFQEQLSNHLVVLPFQGAGAERQGNGRGRMHFLQPCQVWVRELSESDLSLKCRE